MTKHLNKIYICPTSITEKHTTFTNINKYLAQGFWSERRGKIMSSVKLNILNSSSAMVNFFRVKTLFIITDSLGTRVLEETVLCNPS